VPAISRLTGITQSKVRSWLRQQKVHEAFALQRNRQFVFLREKVEPLISSPLADADPRMKRTMLMGRVSYCRGS
jgi:hypothetical protein